MAIRQGFHKAVIMVAGTEDTCTFAFTSFADAVQFIEQQVIEEVEMADAIRDLITGEGYDFEGKNYKLMDVETYLDLYEESEEDSE
jgi:hypothetical protein